jgi:probable HAF family extracellular repeat protein
MRPFRNFRLFPFLVSFAFLSPQLRAEPIFSAQYLGPNNYAADLNDYGEIAGEFHESIQFGQFFDGTRWLQSAEGNELEWSALYGINNQHVAVGARSVSSVNSFWIQAIIVRNGASDGPINLGSLTGTNGNAKALAINDSGVAVGDSLTADGRREAVRFDTNGVVTGLGAVGWESSSAIDINNRGDIAGEWTNSKGETRGFFLPIDGIARDIGTLGGSDTYVKRLNARGAVVGSSMTSSGESHAFVYSNGEMKDLGTLGGNESMAYGINDQGVIVGTSTKQNGVYTPFIKFSGKPMEDLALLTEIPDPDFLILALAINNRGMILARGFKNASNYLLKTGVLEIERSIEGVRLKCSAPENTRIRIETAETLPDWAAVSTNTITTGPLLLNEPFASSARFYRAVIEAPTE